MELSIHDVPGLFEQLGLASSQKDIEDFIAAHRPLSEEIALPDAPWWTPAQSAFLREEWTKDAAWVEAIDQLNAGLR
jgi:hypothetical protein